MKKIFKYQLILILVTPVIFLITSCHKQNDRTTSPSTDDHFSLLSIIEKYYKVANTKVDGKFMFESNLCNNDPALTNIALVGGIFYDKKGNAQTGDGQVSIGGNQYTQNRQGTYGFDKALPQKGLFGTDVTFQITSPSSSLSTNQTRSTSSAKTLTTTLYSPAAISITNIPPSTPVTLVPFQNTLVTWNADPNNPNGVIVIAEFLPGRYINKTTLSQGYTNLMEKTMLVTDNGSTSIPWSFFSIFPQEGHIILWIARGNYSIAGDGKYNYQVGGYTAAAVWDVRVPTPPDVSIYADDEHGTDVTLLFHNIGTGHDYSFTAYAHDSGNLGDVPPGNYNITLTPNASGWYNYSVGCGYNDAGPGAMTFNSVDISSSCNSISIE